MNIPTFTTDCASVLITPGTLSVPPILWFQPSNISGANGAQITTNWSDSGPNNFPITQMGVGTDSPVVAQNTLNGYTVSDDTGNHKGNKITSGVVLSNQDHYSLFVVCKWTSLGGQSTFENNVIGAGNGGGDGFRFGLDSANSQGQGIGALNLSYGNVADRAFPVIPSLSTWHYVILVSDGTAIKAYLDNSTYTIVGGYMTPLSGTNTFQLSASTGLASEYFFGLLADVAYYNSALGSTDRANLVTYAQTKYGLP